MTNLSPVLMVVISAGLLGLGCSSTEDYEMAQKIEMGPFAFQVESASARTWDPDGVRGPWPQRREIRIKLKVLDDQSSGKIHFVAFLSGMLDASTEAGFTPEDIITVGGMIPWPYAKLVDSHGHTFIGGPNEVWPQWIATYSLELPLPPDFTVEGRGGAFRKEHLEMQPQDFQLIITNPDRRKGQPGTVSIQLQ